MRGWEFDYFVDHIATFLIENPNGNYAGALANGMNTIIGKMKTDCKDDSVLYIEEGGRVADACYGLEILANEIIDWQKSKQIDKLSIFLPSGTGTTALFLQTSLIKLGSSIKVYTTPCVGDSAYLREQFGMLEIEQKYHPIIIESQKKWHFGKLYREHYEIWIKLRNETNMEFDMLYDPIGWQVLLGSNLCENILYIHQGGLLGNESMLPRYERKYKDLQ
jgi:1-aminocyclopropane-1-carboxylate deaminase/D-cysteine desulfhydrase-like pyridoxal-dependent ACC family enzyme